MRIKQPYAQNEHKHQNDGKLRQIEQKNKAYLKLFLCDPTIYKLAE